MPVCLENIPYYLCICNKCKKYKKVEPNKKIYNGAQAVRSLGWSFGKDQSVFCDICRKKNHNDHYKWNK